MDWKLISLAPRDGSVVDLWCEGNPSYRVCDARFDAIHQSWVHSVLGVTRLVSNATHWMVRPAGPLGEPCKAEGFAERNLSEAKSGQEGRWAQVYADLQEKGLVWYVRWVPDFMDLEAAGFSHGISIGNIHFDTEEEAKVFAKQVEAFGECLLSDLVTNLGESIAEASVSSTLAEADLWRLEEVRLAEVFEEIKILAGSNASLKSLAERGDTIREGLFRGFEERLHRVQPSQEFDFASR